MDFTPGQAATGVMPGFEPGSQGSENPDHPSVGIPQMKTVTVVCSYAPFQASACRIPSGS